MKNFLILIFLSVFSLNLYSAEAGRDAEIIISKERQNLIGTPEKINDAFLSAISHVFEVGSPILFIYITKDDFIIIQSSNRYDLKKTRYAHNLQLWDIYGRFVSNLSDLSLSDKDKSSHFAFVNGSNGYILAKSIDGNVKAWDSKGNFIYEIADTEMPMSTALSDDKRYLVSAHYPQNSNVYVNEHSHKSVRNPCFIWKIKQK